MTPSPPSAKKVGVFIPDFIVYIYLFASRSLLTFFLLSSCCLFPASVIMRAVTTEVQESVTSPGEYLSDKFIN